MYALGCLSPQMTPAEILKETEKAAGDDNLYQDHMVLIDLRKEVVASQSRLDAVRNEREHVVRRNAVLEPQVQRYLEREGTLQQVRLRLPGPATAGCSVQGGRAHAPRRARAAGPRFGGMQLRLLKMRLAWIKYAVKREEAMGASSRVAEAEQALRTAQAEAAPLVQRDQYALTRAGSQSRKWSRPLTSEDHRGRRLVVPCAPQGSPGAQESGGRAPRGLGLGDSKPSSPNGRAARARHGRGRGERALGPTAGSRLAY